MTILLRVDNFDALPDGGPTQYQAERRGFDIGRETHLDWSLPDPNRHISGKHCEIRFESGLYTLYDLSTNGTFLNGARERVKSPCKLRDGDRLGIGQYVISVHIAEDQPDAAPLGQGSHEAGWMPAQQPSAYESDDIWASDLATPAPIDRRDLIPPKQRAPREAGFESQFVELPRTHENPQFSGDQPPSSPPAAAAPPVAAPPSAAPPSFPPQPADFPSGQPGPESWAIPSPAAAAPIPAVSPPAPSVSDAAFAGPPAVGADQSVSNRAEDPNARPAPSVDPSPPMHPAAPAAPTAPAAPAAAPPSPPGQSAQARGFAGVRGESEPFAPPSFSPPPPLDPVSAPAPFQTAEPHPVPHAAPPQAVPGPGPVLAGGPEDFILHFARGAKINPADLSRLDPAALAEDVGAVMRIMVEHLAVLLTARAKAKTITKSANRTMLAADDNNPLKFLPSADEILTVMFARSRRGFKDARGSVTEAFGDLERHEFATIFAMQKALGKLLEDMSPDAIEADVAKSVFSSRQAKAWELFVQRWEEKSEPHENGVLDVFLLHFAEFYDQQT